MFHSYILVVMCLILTQFVTTDSAQCASNNFRSEESVHHCVWPSNEEDNKQCRINKYEWILRDINTGSFDIEFQLPDISCGSKYHKIFVKLSINEKLNDEESCIHDEKNYKHFKPYSSKIYLIRNCSSGSDGQCQPTCDGNVTARFNFIRTGCFAAVFYNDKRFPESISNINAQYLRTNFTNGAPRSLPFNPKYDSNNRRLNITLVNDPYLWVENNQIIVRLNDFCELVTLHTNKSITYQNNFGQLTCWPSSDNLVNCFFSNVSNGTCNITTFMKNSRCEENTMLNSGDHSCHWTQTYLCAPESDSHELQERVTATGYLYPTLISIVCILAVAVIGCLLWRFKRPSERFVPNSDHELQQSLSKKQNILLLYARDCQLFMKLMESFRTLLESYANIEVFDCYDKSRHWNELSRSPTTWMQRLLSNNEVKIIMVATECAYVRQQALITDRAIRYKDPDANDNLFIAGLHYLNETLIQDNYSRVFVVRFDGFSDDRILFAHFNQYTRFAIPNHFAELINCLHINICANGQTELKKNSELEIVRNDLDHLVQYHNDNPKYLEDLLLEISICI